jgi:hypothetical protein
VNTIKDYVKLTQDLPGTSTGKKALSFLSKLVKDFYTSTSINIVPQDQLGASVSFAERPEFFLQPVIPVYGPPPRA